jgi:hypothetical protein
MASGATYTPIATQTLGSAASTMTFSSIPQTYTDLVLVVNATFSNASTANLALQFNSDTGSNYSATRLLGDGSAASSSRFGGTYMMIGDINNALFSSIISINNYANTTTYKTAISRTGFAGGYLGAYVGLWRGSTGSAAQAINAVTIGYNGSGNFQTGSTFSLYGILAA